MNGIDTDDDAKSDVSGSGAMWAAGDKGVGGGVGEAALAGLEDEDVPVKRWVAILFAFFCSLCCASRTSRTSLSCSICLHILRI